MPLLFKIIIPHELLIQFRPGIENDYFFITTLVSANNFLFFIFFFTIKYEAMRTLLRVTLDVNASNNAIVDGTLPNIIRDTT